MIEIEGESHPVRAIERLIADQASAEDRQAAVRHLIQGCSDCGRRFRLRSRPPVAKEAMDLAIDRAVARMADLARQVATEQAEATELLARLQTLAPSQQRLLLENASAAHTRAVCDGLIELARGQRTTDAQETRRLAELAVVVAERIPSEAAGDAPARAWAELGNSLRICGELAAAGEALTRASELGEECGLDPLAESEILSFWASLETYRRNFDDALRYVQQATELNQLYGDRVSQAKSLLQAGEILSKRDRYVDAAHVRQDCARDAARNERDGSQVHRGA